MPRRLRANPHRRVPRHRPAPDRDRSAARFVSTRHRRASVVRRSAHARRCGPAVLRGRPEAVDLSVPSGRRRALSRRPRRVRRSRAAPHRELPHGRLDRRLHQRPVLRVDERRRHRCATRIRAADSARPRPRHEPHRGHHRRRARRPLHRRGPGPRSRRGGPGHLAGEARRVDGAGGERRASSGPLLRHRGADADPSDAARARPRPRRRGHPGSCREPHAHLEHGRSARPARGAERDRRPERPGRHRRCVALARVGVLRFRSRHVAMARRSLVVPRSRARCRPAPPGRDRDDVAPRPPSGALLAVDRRDGAADRRRVPLARARVRARPAS